MHPDGSPLCPQQQRRDPATSQGGKCPSHRAFCTAPTPATGQQSPCTRARVCTCVFMCWFVEIARRGNKDMHERARDRDALEKHIPLLGLSCCQSRSARHRGHQRQPVKKGGSCGGSRMGLLTQVRRRNLCTTVQHSVCTSSFLVLFPSPPPHSEPCRFFLKTRAGSPAPSEQCFQPAFPSTPKHSRGDSKRGAWAPVCMT